MSTKDTDLSVLVGARMDDFKAAMNVVVKNLKTINKFSEKINKLSKELREQNAHLKGIKQSYAQMNAVLGRAAKDTTKAREAQIRKNEADKYAAKILKMKERAETRASGAMRRSGRAAVSASRKQGMALTQVSYALDDVQYGFRGVMNNLQQVAVQAGAGGFAILGITIALAALNHLLKDWRMQDTIIELQGFESALRKVRKEAMKSGFKEMRGDLLDLRAALNLALEGNTHFLDEFKDQWSHIEGVIGKGVTALESFRAIMRSIIELKVAESMREKFVKMIQGQAPKLERAAKWAGITDPYYGSTEYMLSTLEVEGPHALLNQMMKHINLDAVKRPFATGTDKILQMSGRNAYFEGAVSDETKLDWVIQGFSEAIGTNVTEFAKVYNEAVKRSEDIMRLKKTPDEEEVEEPEPEPEPSPGPYENIPFETALDDLKHRLKLMKLQKDSQVAINKVEYDSLKNNIMPLAKIEKERLQVNRRLEELVTQDPFLKSAETMKAIKNESDALLNTMKLQGKTTIQQLDMKLHYLNLEMKVAMTAEDQHRILGEILKTEQLINAELVKRQAVNKSNIVDRNAHLLRMMEIDGASTEDLLKAEISQLENQLKSESGMTMGFAFGALDMDKMLDPNAITPFTDAVQGLIYKIEELKATLRGVQEEAANTGGLEVSINTMELLAEATQRTFQGLGEDGLKGALGGIMQVIGDMLIMKGKALIMDSAVVEALKFPVGAAAIPLGFSAIALGGFLKGAFGKSAGRGGSSGPRGSSGGGGSSAAPFAPSIKGMHEISFKPIVLKAQISGENLTISNSIVSDNQGDYYIDP